MFTFKFTLHNRPNSDGLHPVLLRLTKDRKSAYYRSGIAIKQKDWNPKASSDKANWIRTANNEHGQLNFTLELLLNKARSIGSRSPELTLDQLKGRLSGKEASADFLDFYKKEVDRKKPVYNTWKKYNSCYGNLVEFRKGPLPYSEFTVSLLKDYRAWRLSQGKELTTIATDLSNFKTVLKQARAEKVTSINPFEHFTFEAGKGKKKEKLTKEELQHLQTAPAEGLEHLARVAFLVQFFLIGSRIADVLLLRRAQIQNGRVLYQMDKTGTYKSVKVSAQLQALLAPYMDGPATGLVLPLLKESDTTGTEEKLKKALGSNTALVNKYLKKLYTRLGITKHITTHVSRHSFASIALKQVGDVRTIQQLLGHSKLATTQVYLADLSEGEHDLATDAVYALL